MARASAATHGHPLVTVASGRGGIPGLRHPGEQFLLPARGFPIRPASPQSASRRIALLA